MGKYICEHDDWEHEISKSQYRYYVALWTSFRVFAIAALIFLIVISIWGFSS